MDLAEIMSFSEFTSSGFVGVTLPITYTLSVEPSWLTFNSASNTFTIMTNDNADVADFLLEVSAADSGDLITDSLSPPSFRIIISPFPVVLIAPNDLYDLVYVLRDPKKTMIFSPFSTAYLGPTSITYSASIVSPSVSALISIGLNLFSDTRTFELDANLAVFDGDFTVVLTAYDSIN